MAFQGSLSELPLPDILQLVAVSGKTGSFTIHNDRDTGRIFLAKGQIVHAQTGRLQGEEAVYELAIWPDGEFLFSPGEVSVPTTIQKSNTSLLMEAARRIDEWSVLAKQVPSTSLVPKFTADGGVGTVSLNGAEWAVVRKIDEEMTIEEIAFALGRSPFETAKVIYGLITHGLVQLEEGPDKLSGEALSRIDAQRLGEIAGEVRRRANSYLTGHERAQQLGELLPGETDEKISAEGLLELIRSAEQAVSTALGPNQARSFRDSVSQLFTQGAKGL